MPLNCQSMKTLTFSLFTALALLAALSEAAPLGTAFTYQGRLTESGSTATGTYDLQFILLDAATGGNPVGTPFVASAVAVNNGLFTTSIDFGSTAFDGRAFWMQIGVRPSGNPGGFTPLLTLQQITPTPYALYALSAGSGGSGGFSTSGTSAYYLTGSVGIGTSTPQSALDVHGDIGVTGALSAGGPVTGVSSGLQFGFGVVGNDPGGNVSSVVGVSPSASTRVGLLPESGSSENVKNGSGAGYATVVGGSSGGGVSGSSTTGVGVLGKSVSWEGVHGESSAGNAAAVAGVNLNASSGLGVYGESRGAGVGVWGKSLTSEGVHGESSAGIGVWGKSVTSEAVHGESSAGNAAAVAGINLNSGGGAVGLYGESRGAGVGVWGKSLTFEGVHGESASANAAAVTGVGLGTGPGVYGESHGGYGGYFIGPVRVGSLVIVGGADLAEPFAMTEQQIEKGSVVVIDDEHPGGLMLSTQSYDQRVAGIVSGANGVNPGISLSQQGALSGGRNVALSGRVYVLADASGGAIKPGDLLTTSDTPGHAMKVTDHARAQGAIIGKAMSSLKESKGMVLVLVSLQ